MSRVSAGAAAQLRLAGAQFVGFVHFLSLSLSLLTHRFLPGDVAEPRLIRLPTRHEDAVDGGGW